MDECLDSHFPDYLKDRTEDYAAGYARRAAHYANRVMVPEPMVRFKVIRAGKPSGMAYSPDLTTDSGMAYPVVGPVTTIPFN